jgi:uncharacterized membrane protein
MNGFALIIISALMHSLWNLLLKKTDNKFVFNYQMHLINLSVFTLAYPVFFKNYLFFDLKSVIYGFISASFFALYHLCLTKAYTLDDASLIYPITTSSPLFVLIWATLFLNEKLSFSGILGILIIIFGVITISGIKIVKLNFHSGILWAIMSSFFYSIGSISDKIGVGNLNFILYVYSLVFFMTMFLTLFSTKYCNNHFNFFKQNFRLIIICGIIVFFSFITYRAGLKDFQVSYASALRQISSLFGAIMSVIFLKEIFRFNRVVGAILIVTGTILIKISI